MSLNHPLLHYSQCTVMRGNISINKTQKRMGNAMKRPICYFVVFYIFGILAGQYFPDGLMIPLFGCLIALLSLFAGLRLKLYEPAGFLLFFLLGVMMLQHAQGPPTVEEQAWLSKTDGITVSGTVSEISADGSHCTLQRLTIDNTTVSHKSQKLLVTLKKAENLAAGDFVSLEGRLYPFSPPENPGAFDERIYYQARGYSFSFYGEVLERSPSEKDISPSIFAVLREKVNQVYKRCLPPKEAGLLQAMITGERSELDPVVKDSFYNAGIGHIIAISGLHVTLAALLFASLIETVFHLSKKKSAPILFVLLVFYLFFTGCAPSAVRAVTVACVALLGRPFSRQGELLNSTAIAAFLLLLIQPLYLWDIGFQLSFFAILSVFLGGKVLALSPIPFAIFLFAALTPITLFYFYRTSLFSIVANLLILPYVGLVVGLGIAIGILGLFFFPAAALLSGMLYALLGFFQLICQVAASLPWLVLFTGRPTILWILLYYALLFLFIGIKRKAPAYATIPCVLIVMLCFCPFPKKTEIAYLSIGQGDCQVITAKAGQTIVIDGGGNPNKELGKNTGVQKVLPYLEYKGCKTVDLLVITHMDFDHAAGAYELLDQIPVLQIALSPYADKETNLYRLIKEKAEAQQIPIVELRKGQSVPLSEEASLSCLHPGYTAESDENGNSLVVQYQEGETRFLFTGDIGMQQETRLLEQLAPCDVLKVAHHGSATSSSEAFLAACLPANAVISSGRNNRYGLPSPEAVIRLEKYTDNVYNTAQEGGILFCTNGKQVWKKQYRRDLWYERIQRTIAENKITE